MAAYTVVFIRHGESEWNKQNRFTGWFDVDLSRQGIEEARKAGQMLKDGGFTFDIAFTSMLKRTIKTLYYVQDELDIHWIPVVKHWRLNEAMCGALHGLNKSETATKHGEEQVKNWRRSYNIPPPPVDRTSPYWPGTDPKYQYVDTHLLPMAECLRDTVARTLPFWYDQIVPEIKKGQRVIIAGHGNSLRAMVKYLDNMSDDNILDLDIPNAIPLIYELDEELKPIKHYYIASNEDLKAAMDKVAAQGKAK